jgi:hypothetical protein
MNLFVPKLYTNQHRVLEKVYNVPSVREFPNIDGISKSLKLSVDDVMQAAHLLKGRGFAFVNRDKLPFVVGCTPDGAQALLQKALIEEGKEKGKTNLLRWMQITGILVASTISIGTFILNTISTVNNSRSIETLKAGVNTLKKTINALSESHQLNKKLWKAK